MSNLHNMSWMQFDCSEEMLLKIAELDAVDVHAMSLLFQSIILVKHNYGSIDLMSLQHRFINRHMSRKKVLQILSASGFFEIDQTLGKVCFNDYALSCFAISRTKKHQPQVPPGEDVPRGNFPLVNTLPGGNSPVVNDPNAPTRREERIENKENKNISVSDVCETPTTPTETQTETDKRKKTSSVRTLSPEEADFNRQMKEHYPRVSAMKKPLTWDQYCKLKEKYSVEEIGHTLKCMENRSNLNTRYVSAYLTILNWLHYELGRRG